MQFLAQLVGNQFAPPEGKQLFKELVKGDALTLVRNPDNKYDANAIEVHHSLHGTMLGHINKEVAIDLAPYLDGDASVIADGQEPEVTCTLYDQVDPKKPTLLIEVTTGYEVDTEVEDALAEGGYAAEIADDDEEAGED